MRIRLIGTAALVLASVPAWAQEIPAEVTGPRKVTAAMVRCTDLPINTYPDRKITIKGVALVETRLATMNGPLMIGRTPEDGLAIGNRYSVHRLHNETPMSFGATPSNTEGFASLNNVAIITITAIDEFNALAQIDSACNPVQPGDFIQPLVEPTLPTTAAPMGAIDFTDRGKVLFGTQHRNVFGDGDTFSIDRGTVHGVVPGARYAVYRDPGLGPPGMPLVYLGEAVVLVVNELTSKVALVRAVEPVYGGDTVVPRRQQ